MREDCFGRASGIGYDGNTALLFATIVDEPRSAKETFGPADAEWNAAPVTGAIMRSTDPITGKPLA